jgi:hypothetical protein
MIWQLVRRDQDWRMLGVVTLCLCIGALVGTIGIFAGTGFSHFHVSAELLVSSMLPTIAAGGLFGAYASGAGRRATLFQTALPISARDLFVAKLVSQVAGVWYLLLAATAAFNVVGTGWSVPILPLITAGALVAVSILALLSVRLRELSVPSGLAIPLLTVLVVLDFLLLFPGPLFSFARPGIVVPVCAFLFGALLWRDLSSMPKAFQVAPMDAIAERPAKSGVGLVRPVWWPLWQSLSRGSPLVTLILSAIFLTNGMWSLVAVMLAVFVSAAWASLRWLWPLPVDRRGILAMLLVPPLLLSTAAQLLWPGGFARAAAMMALTLVLTLAFLLPNKWSLHGSTIGSMLALSFFGLFIFGPAGLLVADAVLAKSVRIGIHQRSHTADFLAGYVTRAVPGNPLLLVAGTVAALAALYWLVQRQFESADFVQFTQTRIDSVNSSSPLRS